MSETDEDKVALPPLDDDDDDIDDVTDVWDEEKLKAALGGLRPDDGATGPATQSTRKEEASIQVDDALGSQPTGPRPPSPGGRHTPQPAPSGGLSWPLTIGLAVTLAVAVYLLVTFLKS